MSRAAGRVVIGMDPHKRSATIEAINEQEQVLTRGRYGTDTDGYQQMLAAGREFPDRVWAVQGCAGIGRHIAQRLVADGETVLDVPCEAVRQGAGVWHRPRPQTDPVDAHSVAVAGLRSPGLRTVVADDVTVALRLLVDRRDKLGRTRTEIVSRIHVLLLELIPGGAKKFLTRGQASYLLPTAPEPVGIVAQTATSSPANSSKKSPPSTPPGRRQDRNGSHPRTQTAPVRRGLQADDP